MDAIIAKISFLLFSTFEAQHNGAGGLYSSGIHITLILDVRRYITGNLQGGQTNGLSALGSSSWHIDLHKHLTKHA